MPTALITGCAGQDGYYLARYLLGIGYEVHGIVRKASVPSTRLDEFLIDFPGRFEIHSGDILDAGYLHRVLDRAKPSEVYNLAAMSDVAASFEAPDYALQVNTLGTCRLLEALRGKGARFYQASTSELFGDSHKAQNEDTPMHPMSPYAAGKLASYWLTRVYRRGYGMHASNGILFNHESKMRADCFVTMKIAKYVAKWFTAGGGIEPLRLGNLDAVRDWSHAADMARGMWMIVQHEKPDDYVLASGIARTVREFVDEAFTVMGKTVDWADAARTRGFVDDRLVVAGNTPEFIRPLDVPHLQGDATKASRVLGWTPEISFRAMVQEMVESELAKLD